MGIDLEGERDILGMWIGSSGGKGAKFWHSVLTELANRGITDALVVCCDGLKGLPEAIRTSWPLAERSTTWWVRLRSLPVGLFGRGAILQKSHKSVYSFKNFEVFSTEVTEVMPPPTSARRACPAGGTPK